MIDHKIYRDATDLIPSSSRTHSAAAAQSKTSAINHFPKLVHKEATNKPRSESDQRYKHRRPASADRCQRVGKYTARAAAAASGETIIDSLQHIIKVVALVAKHARLSFLADLFRRNDSFRPRQFLGNSNSFPRINSRRQY